MVSLALARFGLPSASPVVVGVSGGVDSTVLLRLLHEAGVAVVAAHVNYGLRGAESDEDEAFVRVLADELSVPVETWRVTLPDDGNRQEAAREARYAFFREVAETYGAEAVAVGHTQDDQAETVLLHLFRGTGPRGLAGMPHERPLAPGSSVRLIRPLLDVPRAEIEGLARAHGWTWREDASNADLRYRRNVLRTHVLPLIEAAFGPGTSERIAATAGRVRALLDERPDKPPTDLRLDTLRTLPPEQRHARYLAVLRRMAPQAPRRSAAVAELDALLDAQPGTHVVWPGVVIWRDRAALVFAPPEAEEPAVWTVTVDTPTVTPWGVLTATPLDGPPSPFAERGGEKGARPQGGWRGGAAGATEGVSRVPQTPSAPYGGTSPRGGEGLLSHAGDDPCTEVVDARVLRPPLVLRPWQAGDRFRPLGLDGTKLVSDLLTERQVPPSERAHQLVLCSDEAIVWVVGHRLAEAARVQPDTTQAVRLTWISRSAA